MPRRRRRSSLAAARKASGYTQESLASALEVDRSTVIRWESGERTPVPFVQPRLARLLGQSREQLRALIDGPDQSVVVDDFAEQVRRPSDGLAAAFDWLDQHAVWPRDATRRKVMSRVARVDAWELRDQIGRRANVSRRQVADVLSDYYRRTGVNYRVRCAGQEIATTILSRPEWLDLACPLSAGADELRLVSATAGEVVSVDDVGAKHAVRRLAEAVALDVRIADAPIYRLLDIDVSRGRIGGTVGLAPFVRYALTADLLENELVDAVVSGQPIGPDTMPLRARYLPDVASVLDVSNRLCAGGVLALCAIARPADPYRGGPDYTLLVQERSGLVVNAAGRLSVIPKGFHQPMTDFRADAQVGATLRREMEEELFGRIDIDSTAGRPRAIEPMHRSRLSEPMRWLLDEPGRLRMECTGLGLNLVSGNYEFAGLVVIEDEEFWSRFGGHIEANWESVGLRQYSSLDCQAIEDLVVQGKWSDEGLFAFLQGVRRLAEIGGGRVNLPASDLLG
jgi:transcriptional regulator with XRE-family HTH domain